MVSNLNFMNIFRPLLEYCKIAFAFVIIFGVFNSCDNDEEAPTPEIVSINPSSAPPNTLIAITGRAFSPVFSDNKVMFNGKEALVSNASPTQLNVLVPADAQTGPVTVTINGKMAINQPLFTLIPFRTDVESVSPISGGFNTLVTIVGSHFLPLTSNNIVTFNGVAAIVESSSPTELSVRVPLRAGSGPVIVNGVVAGNFSYIPDVYVVGHVHDILGYAQATYWKNGVRTTLATNKVNTYGSDMTFIGDDAYVTGTSYLAHSVARCWKNGVEVPLTNENGSLAQDVIAAGNDIYIAGFEAPAGKKTIATYWKNGTSVNLTDGSSHASANSIVVHGDDVYACGNSTLTNGNTVATYWKNSVAYPISEKITFAHGMFVSGNDVYLTGSERNTGPGVGFVTYWKNGAPVYLSPGLGSAAGYDIVVSGNDVYVAGVEDNAQGITVAKYWKNGNAVVLSDGSRRAFAKAIDVIGGDVYVAGYEYNAANITVVKLWKNGVATMLTDGGFYSAGEGLFLR